MSTHTYVGIHDPEQPGRVRLRYVHSDGYLHYMIPTLRTIWAEAAERDTRRLVTLLLAHDWDHLDPDTAETSTSPVGAQPIPGVGVTLVEMDHGTGVWLPPGPITVMALSATGDLHAEWIYLLDPGTDTITVHTNGGDVVDTQPLAP